MSWLDDLSPEQERANAEGALRFTDAPPVPGFLTNAEQGFKGLPRGGLEAVATIRKVGGDIGARAKWVGGAFTDTISGEAGIDNKASHRAADDSYNADMAANQSATQGLQDWANEYRIDPTTVGTAGQILDEVNAIIPRTIVGASVAGPLGGALSAGVPAGMSEADRLEREGIDADTAAQVGTVRGLTTGLGAMLPGSGVVKGLIPDLVATTGLNVGLGVVDRYSSGEILREGGYEAQAAQYDALDATAMSVDAVLGAAFWGVGRVTQAPGKTEVNAALALNADLQRRTAGPGLPVDPASARAHGDAIDGAVEALLRGERVDVGEAIRNATFLRRPVAPVEAAAEYAPATASDFDTAVVDVLQTEGGYVADDAGKGETNLGINTTANPDVDIKGLTPEAAKALYRERYWDAIDADNLPPAVRAIAFDAAVNQGPARARKWAAEANGDPAKLIALRRAHYAELVKANPKKFGKYAKAWEARLQRFETDAPPRTGVEAATVIDTRLAALDEAGSTGFLPPDQVRALVTEADEIEVLLREQDKAVAAGVVLSPAQRLTVPERALAETRRVEIRQQLEQHRTAQGQVQQATKLRTRLERIDADSALIALADELVPPVRQPKPQAPRVRDMIEEVGRSPAAQPDAPRTARPAPLTPQATGFGAAGLDVPAPRGTAPAPARAAKAASVMDADAAPPKPRAEGEPAPASPAVDAATQAAALDPSLTIALDDGTVVPAADALVALAREQVQAQTDASGYLAAANCFLRSA